MNINNNSDKSNDAENVVDVGGHKPYSVSVGGSLGSVGARLKNAGKRGKAVIVTDDNVSGLYLKTVKNSLEGAGFECPVFTIRHGEGSKTMASLSALLGFMAENGVERSDSVAALGGGVVGDLAGFAAAVYMRGVSFIQLPTSLLAMVDSSVGGKSAVDLPEGKNLAGAFISPEFVLCDVATLATLPPSTYADGLAEVVKYGMIESEKIFSLLEDGRAVTAAKEIITECVRIKSRIVGEDEFESGNRRLLNFGHTVAHAIEKCSGYTVTHGFAVAAGMAVITRAAEKAGVCESGTAKRLCSLLEKLSLPAETAFSTGELYAAALSDKKFSDGKIKLVLARRVGECIIEEYSPDGLKTMIEAGRAPAAEGS